MYYEYHYINEEGEDCVYNSNTPYLSEVRVYGEKSGSYCSCCGSYLYDDMDGYFTVTYCIIHQGEIPVDIPDVKSAGEFGMVGW